MKKKQAAEPQWPVLDGTRALDYEPGLLQKKNARTIARELKRAAEASERRKGTPLQAAMGVLNFRLTRAGKSLAPEQREVLQRAKEELRKLFATSGNFVQQNSRALLRWRNGTTERPREARETAERKTTRGSHSSSSSRGSTTRRFACSATTSASCSGR